MFGISMWELGLILLVALILLGPRQLTETARVLGRLYREVTRMTNDLRNSIDLDSPTSGMSSSPHVDVRPSHGETAAQSGNGTDMLIPSGERSGPDFYADLLEKSKEDDEERQSGSSGTGDEPKESPDGNSAGRETGKNPHGKEDA
ncbi:MAG: twin-arginine translocase TatA/TatE family subunit [Pseudomonadota bacterium]